MIVVDTSVAFKWLIARDEEFRDKALVILQNHIDQKEVIIIPSLIYLEIANALVTKRQIPELKINKSLKFINELDLKIYSFNKEDYIEAAILARKYNTTVYDMLYAVVAKRNKSILVTADENFIKKTKFKFVKHIKDF